MFKKVLPYLFIVGLLLSACGAAATPAPQREGVAGFAPGGAPVEQPLPAQAPAATAGVIQDASNGGAQANRIVIKNASLSLLVKDAAATSDEISQLAESMGGFVISTNVYETTYGPNDTRVKQATVSIRVPADRLDEALSKIKDMAVEVQSENITGQDVTSEYTDLQSRLRNLQAAETQLQNIMDGATKTEDVLSVYNQLVSIREQIEVIKGQIKYYDESAAFSQISIDLIPDVVAQPLDIGGWRPVGVARGAVELLIKSLQALVNVLLYLAICGIPFAIIFGLPTWLVVRSVRRRRRQAKEGQAKEKELGAAG